MLYSGDKISIIIFTRGAGKPLVNTLESMVNQTYKNMEIFLIVNNINKEIQDNVRPYQQLIRFTLRQKSFTSAKVLNDSLKLASGKYFAVLAAGDVWQPGVLAQKVDFLEKNRDAFAVCSDFDIFDKNKIIKNSFFGQKKLFQDKKKGSAFFIEEPQSYLISNYHKLLSMLLIRNEAYSFHGPFDENMEAFADFDLFLKILKGYKLGCINKVLISKFFDAYKVSYYINDNVKQHIAYLDYLLDDFAQKNKRCEKDVKRQLERNYFSLATYLLKSEEKAAARDTAIEYMSRYNASFGFFWLLFKSILPNGLNSDRKHYNYFRMEGLQNNLLDLYF